MADDDDSYYIPLEDQRVFGAGIKRKRIAFVPASSTESSRPTSAPPTSKPSSIADRYLSIVLSKSSSNTPTPNSSSQPSPTPQPSPVNDPRLCAICAQPVSPTHETTIAHQLCLTHSHPPSHLDRSRPGLRYLSSYGWDPDSRVGLGARSEGQRFPIKPVEKHDTVGLREREDADEQMARVKARKVKRQESAEKGPVKKLNAKEVRRRDDEARRRAEKLRGLFYQTADVERYLGDGG